MTPLLHPLDLAAMSEIRVDYSGSDLRPDGVCTILVAAFSGVYREGDAGRLDARFIHASSLAGVVAWDPEGMIFDFSGLDYRQGDDLRCILDVGERAFGIESLPTAIVVGPRSEEGVRSLFGHHEPDSFPEGIFPDSRLAREFIESEIADLLSRLESIMRAPA